MNKNEKIVLYTLLKPPSLFQESLDGLLYTAFNILNQIEEYDNDEEDDILCLLYAGSIKQSPLRISNYIEEIVDVCNEHEFQRHFRMPRIAFEFLLETIDNHKDQMLGGDHFKIPLKKQLLAVIWLLATPDSYRSVGERFNLSKSSLSICFFRIIDILNKLANMFIKWPNAQQREATKNNFENKYKLKGVVGAIDGCYIPMKAPADQKLAYTNRKCFTAVTLQAVCDNNLRYLDCFIGFPSSVHDSRIFRNSELYLKITTNVDTYFNEEEKIIADKAYPVESWCIPPFINRGNLTQQQTYFNTKHAQCRSVIERSFALLFGRFRRLRYIDMNRFDFVPATILAACVLHNACLDHGNEFIEEYIHEGFPHAIRNNPGDDQEGMIWNYGDRQRARGNGFIERNHMMQDLWQNRRISIVIMLTSLKLNHPYIIMYTYY